MFPPETTGLTYGAIWDTRAKTSTRIILCVFYAFLRTCEVIDWLLPVKNPDIQ